MDLSPMNMAIVKHVGLYRLTFPIVVERLFCKARGGIGGTVLSELARAGFLRHHKKVADGAFPGSIAYYTLTPRGARIAGVSDDRGAVMGAPAVRSHLAVLWFCCLGEQRRHRLEPSELRAAFGDDAPYPNVAFCIGEEDEGPKIYRVYESTTNVALSIKRLRAAIAKLWESPQLRPWLMSGDLGFAVLAETRAKCGHLTSALKAASKDKPGISDECHVIVRFAPSPLNMKSALSALNKEKK